VTVNYRAETYRLTSMVRALVNVLPDFDAEVKLRQQLGREAYQRGYEDGFQDGYERAHADMAKAWAEVARPVSKGALTYQELEARRWTLRGEQRTRETFGDPHPDDYIPQSRQETAA
jgi:hypothetical protein